MLNCRYEIKWGYDPHNKIQNLAIAYRSLKNSGYGCKLCWSPEFFGTVYEIAKIAYRWEDESFTWIPFIWTKKVNQQVTAVQCIAWFYAFVVSETLAFQSGQTANDSSC